MINEELFLIRNMAPVQLEIRCNWRCSLRPYVAVAHRTTQMTENQCQTRIDKNILPLVEFGLMVIIAVRILNAQGLCTLRIEV